ncbi:phage/plasmid primase, P4 family [Candidatus Uabimicrobium amorphum]|uniref:SF3 helicase domain-containing protein n=1 Tax=Uabimicrobium amorphum TaxID=2596890 RepID=A0A5S9IU44_UABAM|nr:phage/plasmid primase, P4 family [Candidatus Uabimicrobium amorphum]BBM86655.1 hypothetical protein UABAM_05041 [Candidatus Uabimicrobium amorphum]
MSVQQKILDKLDIEAFYKRHMQGKITKGNNDWFNGHCPLPGHSDCAPSFGFNAKTGAFKCFGCNQQGSVFHFVQQLKNTTNKTSIDFLSVEAGVSKKESLEDKVYRYHDNLMRNLDKSLAAVEALGISIHTAKKLKLGYMPTFGKYEARLIFPIFDEYGNVFTLKKYSRKAPSKTKSKFERGGKISLYGIHEITPSTIDKPVVICAGEKDKAVAQTHLGDDFVFTTFTGGEGSLPSDKQLIKTREKLKGRNVIVIYDVDEAGQIGAHKVAGFFSDICNVKIAKWPGSFGRKFPKGDITDFITKHKAQDNVEALRNILNTAQPFQGTKINTKVNVYRKHTDMGNAARLVKRHGHKIRYCHAWGKWLVWDGTRWEIDTTEEIVRLAKDTVISIYHEADMAKSEKEYNRLIKHAERSQSYNRIMSMIKLAKSEPGVPIQTSQLDTNPWLLNVENGTVNLKTGELQPHNPQDLITKKAPVHYDPEAPCPTWNKFLETVTSENEEIRKFLQSAVGYSLTGNNNEECMFMLHGSGRNGKSKFLGAIEKMMGDYAKPTRPETFLKKRGSIPNDLAALKGARFVPTVETEQGGKLAESLIKQITGGDTIQARFLHKEFFEYKPEFKIWMATNHRPTIEGNDMAIWERLCVVPFNTTIPAQERDKFLSYKLAQELSGILNWAIKGCLNWQERGLCKPDSIEKYTNKYKQDQK